MSRPCRHRHDHHGTTAWECQVWGKNSEKSTGYGGFSFTRLWDKSKSPYKSITRQKVWDKTFGKNLYKSITRQKRQEFLVELSFLKREKIFFDFYFSRRKKGMFFQYFCLFCLKIIYKLLFLLVTWHGFLRQKWRFCVKFQLSCLTFLSHRLA